MEEGSKKIKRGIRQCKVVIGENVVKENGKKSKRRKMKREIEMKRETIRNALEYLVRPIKGNFSRLKKPYNDIQFNIPIRKNELQQSILLKGKLNEQEELEILLPYLKDCRTFIDAGANIGTHGVFFAKVLDMEGYSFEPQRDIFEILEKNIKINDVIIKPFNLALGERNGFVSINNYVSNNVGATSFKIDKEGNIPMKSLDSLDFKKIDFIKIDVEGFELELLKGGIELIKKDKPIIFIEILDSTDTKEETRRLLKELNYKLELKIGSNELYIVDSEKTNKANCGGKE